ncbi:MAG: nucleic acid-binding protein [Chloroflexi bacterium]|jgi:hypothetical protein|nr:nucleic acid-binding protein [Chloroflexota bacterium]|tara:strand:- start:289 stop:495 length:207 start_codon:yes stop_codon:yes gene_type:complete
MKKYECIKCNNSKFIEGKINTTGSGLSRFLNIQLHSFLTVSCDKCGFTELFRKEKEGFWLNLIQFFTN